MKKSLTPISDYNIFNSRLKSKAGISDIYGTKW